MTGTRSVEVLHRASPWTTRIATGSASSRWHGWLRRRLRRTPTLCGYGKNRELGLKFSAFAFRTFRLLLAENQSFEIVLTFLADIFKNRHEENSEQKIAVFYLKSNSG
jgi:hypothetical protein